MTKGQKTIQDCRKRMASYSKETKEQLTFLANRIYKLIRIK